MSIQLDTRVTPSLHPANVARCADNRVVTDEPEADDTHVRVVWFVVRWHTERAWDLWR